jgi:hypothetical protein
MNVDLKQGINPGTLPADTVSLNSYMWIVNTSDPSVRTNSEMLVPCTSYANLSLKQTNVLTVNRAMLTALRPAGSSPSTMLTVAKRALNATSGQFMPLNPNLQTVRELPEDRIQIQNVNQLDGQYIILVTQPKPVGASESH